MHDMSQAKVKEGLSNLQANVKLGFECPFTLTEDCAAALYCELVDIPYITRVRGGNPETGKPENLLDLGPYHQQKLDFCKKIAEDPLSALGSSSADGVTALPKTFEGKQVEHPKVIHAVLRAAVDLPHLPAMIAAFFRGAHAKLDEFVEEFKSDGDIAGLSTEERAAAFLSTTNDVNEGALGMLRVALRKSPNLSLISYNHCVKCEGLGSDTWAVTRWNGTSSGHVPGSRYKPATRLFRAETGLVTGLYQGTARDVYQRARYVAALASFAPPGQRAHFNAICLIFHRARV
jgi:hypothetical protein